MVKQTVAILVSLLGSYTLISCILCTSVSDDTDNNSSYLDGENLLNMGTKFRLPLLRLLGKTFIDMECRFHLCTQWSTWSACPKNQRGQFGARKRSRNCHPGASQCRNASNRKLDVEHKVCEGFCPKNYNLTKNEFCLKYNTKKMSQTNAESMCKADGGYLVNLNTKIKSEDAHDVLKIHNALNKQFWINGKRSDTSSPHEYSYAGPPVVFSNWYPGHPSTAGDHLCLIEHPHASGRKWVSNPCAIKHPFMCEIMKNY